MNPWMEICLSQGLCIHKHKNVPEAGNIIFGSCQFTAKQLSATVNVHQIPDQYFTRVLLKTWRESKSQGCSRPTSLQKSIVI
jgi:hypothetical protein